MLLKQPPKLDAASLYNKIVCNRRGGYCFEQNGFLLHVLESLGFRVTPISARVRVQQPREFVPPRTHLFLRVDIEGVPWLADMGVGGMTPTAPLRMDTAEPQTTPHETRRIIHERGVFFHQVLLGEQWCDVCEFTGEVMHPIDREVANWWTGTNPASKFSENILAACANSDGTRHTLLNQDYVHRRADGFVIEQRVLKSTGELLDVLSTRFHLHFPDGTKFGVAGL